jgi:uncharacterized RDD family membrane protein YckC
MKCPKCHYLSFDPEPRCRNCGYDLEVDDTDLALRTAENAEQAEAPLPDLQLRERPVTLEIRPASGVKSARESRLGLALADDPVFADEPDEPTKALEHPTAETAETADVPELVYEIDEDVPVDDLPVVEREPALRPFAALSAKPAALVPAAPVPVAPITAAPVPVASAAPVAPAAPVEPTEPRRVPFRSPNTTAELPLFVKGMADRDDLADDVALQMARAQVANPRPPLAVRRAVPEPVRTRQKMPDRRLGPIDRDLLDDLRRVEREEAAKARADARAFAESVRSIDGTVEPIHRFGAAAVDTAMLGGIAAFVFWATLRLCDVTLTGLGLAALVPLVVFLALMDLGYLLMFTAAGGQTVGKMLMGIRVVTDEVGSAQLTLRQATWRAVLTMISVVGLGLGWLPALSSSGLALHDRLTHTRVVRA